MLIFETSLSSVFVTEWAWDSDILYIWWSRFLKLNINAILHCTNVHKYARTHVYIYTYIHTLNTIMHTITYAHMHVYKWWTYVYLYTTYSIMYLLKNNRLESIMLQNFDYYTFWYFLSFLPVYVLLTLYFSGMHYADSV